MVVRATVQPEMLTWARERAGIPHDQLARRFPKLDAWEDGALSPTLRQLEEFAQATHAPIGFLFLPQPPVETVPLPDFRTMGNVRIGRPSPDLLDTVYQCQLRQDWYREFARANREDPLSLVGSLRLQTSVSDAATRLRTALAFDVHQRGSTWTDAFTVLRDNADGLGILVMVNGVVGSNTHRKLDPEEFRGFALVDDLAPVVFVNGTDTRAAQTFTLAHELAHIWLGESALSDADFAAPPSNSIEQWCNQVAAEFLVPLDSIRAQFQPDAPLSDELARLARTYKVSTLVILRRLHDGGHLDRNEYQTAYTAERARVISLLKEQGGGGGNFYNTQPVRVSKRFARAVIASTLEGQTLHRDAFQLLGFKKLSTFQELGRTLQVM